MNTIYTTGYTAAGNYSSSAGNTYRYVIPAADIVQSGAQSARLRLFFRSAAPTVEIRAVIGLQAESGSAWDIDPATLTPLTKGGAATMTITISDPYTDEINLPFTVDGTRAVVVAFYRVSGYLGYVGNVVPGYVPGDLQSYVLSGEHLAATESGFSSTSTLTAFSALEYTPPRIIAALVQTWGDAAVVASELHQPWGIKTGADLIQPWSNAPQVRAALYQPWGNAPAIRAELLQRWASSFTQRACLEQNWHIFGVVLAELEQRWAITSSLVRGELLQGWDLRELDLLRAELVQRWAIEADGTDVAGAGSGGVMRYGVSVRVDGVAVGISKLNIEGGTDGDVLTCDLDIGTENDYLRCTMGSALEVTITSADGVDDFVFVITAPRITEEHGNTQYIVEAMSPGVLLGEPYADPVEGELSGLASGIAATLAGDVPILWQTVDWEIAPATWIAAGETPLALLKTLAAAVGAVVQSMPDGSLLVVPEYEVSINQLGSVTPGLSLVENLDCFTTGSTPELKSGYNKFYIGDQMSSADSLRMDEETISKRVKLVRGYEVPWKGTLALIHTGGEWATIEPMGVEERQETETIEIVAGAGKVQFPIYTRDAIAWGQINLGSVTVAEDGSVSAAVDNESLLTITYTTRCQLWRVTNARTEQLQLVIP